MEHFHARSTLHALLRRLGPQANAAPARHLMQPHSRQRDAVAVPSDLHACRHAAVLAVCAAGFTCRDLLALRTRRGAALIALTCNCHELVSCRQRVRQDRVWAAQLCPQSISLRCVIGHRCATVAFVALALARMPLQAQAGPSMSVSAASSRAHSSACCRLMNLYIRMSYVCGKDRRATATLSFAGL